MRVYLIRHAQSEGNVMDLRAATTVAEFNELLLRMPDLALTAEGQRQALVLAERMSGRGVERLYSSPFLRALDTARALGAGLGLEPVIVDELREVVPGLAGERRRSSSLRRHWIRSFAAMARTRGARPSWATEYRRAKIAWQRITAEPVNVVAAVSHAWTISMILLALRRQRHWRILTRDLRNAGVSVIEQRVV
jgi:broad specificity phosphatase PhoE